MPGRRKHTAAKSAVRAVPFRSRYKALEERRLLLQKRLAMLGATVQANPAYRNATKLLNQRFRTARISQRESVLDAASWLIDLLSITPP
jgi:hypothetical protein